MGPNAVAVLLLHIWSHLGVQSQDACCMPNAHELRTVYIMQCGPQPHEVQRNLAGHAGVLLCPVMSCGSVAAVQRAKEHVDTKEFCCAAVQDLVTCT